MSVAERRRQGGSATAPVEANLSNLSLAQKAKPGSSAPVADSWEEAASDSDGEGPSTPTGPAHPPASATLAPPHAPPPTPASPSARFDNPYALPLEFPSSVTPRGDDGGRRPDKTTSAASRMIAGALGVRAPRKGEEMRAFEQAAVDKEKARREREKAERDEAERRKRSVWEE